jgi:S-DNA-T family DNA segregation ATPase FtsK/SpoIIIE
MRISLTALTGQTPRDIVINGDSDMTVASVAKSLIRVLGDRNFDDRSAGVRNFSQPQALWMDGRMLDPTAPAVRELRDGAVVTVDPKAVPATVTAEPSGLVEIRVVGGPAAGTVHRLGLGTTALGTALDADVRLGDPAVLGRSLQVVVARDRVTVAASPGTAATLDGAPVGDARTWPPGGMLVVGSTVLSLATSAAPDAHLESLPEGGLAFDRPPRAGRPWQPKQVEAPQPPRRGERQRLGLLGAALLSVAGPVLAVMVGPWWWGLLALSWPAVRAGEWAGDRLRGRASFQQSVRAYKIKLAEFEETVEALRREDEAERRDRHPDPAQVLLTGTGPRRRLWERRIADPDTLHLRVGLADQPALIEPAGERTRPAPVARMVPVTLPLAELGVVGLTGPRPLSRGLARWLVAQAATLHSPRDLAIVVLSAEAGGAEHWNWVRWLPHCVPREDEDCVALVGTDAESVARRVTELAMLITGRRRAEGRATSFPSSLDGPAPHPYNILLVLDGARELRRVPGMPQVLSAGRRYGVHAICIDDEDRLLPEECTAVAAWDWDRADTLRLRGYVADLAGPVLADQVSPAWCDRLARALAPVRDVSPEEPVPASVRLLDLLGMPDPTADHVLAAWSDPATAGRTTRVPIGLSASGPFRVDLRAEGPHALIVGASGTGKSELLQTIIAALAVANRPDEMTFLLIDHRGGAAFGDCTRLPHTVGTVTDLDGHLAARALESLAAELRRREHLLEAAGAADLEDYGDLRDRAAGELEPLPRLVLAVDEFAVLGTDLPGFVAGLVDIGRRGRSLGVHLILATRRPAAAMTAGLRAGTGLRIALRVAEAEESIEVLESAEAARIPKSAPGRCHVRSGAAAPHTVQAARIGARRPGAAGTTTAVLPLPWQGLGRALPAPEAAGDESATVTDLGVLVQAIRDAAQRSGIDRRPSPWLPPLPERVTLVPRTAAGGSVVEPPPIEFGLADLPAAQAREPLTLDLVRGGHVYVAGAARSGRSTVLRTLAGTLAAACSPYDAQIYAIDCGAGALLPLVALPHCGAVVGRDQFDRVERLLAALTAEVARRRRLLTESGFASIAEQRAAVTSAERLPWMVLLLDQWEGFAGAFENYDYGRLVDTVLRLLREGATVGLRGVFTGDRSGLGGQVSTVFDRRLVLRMSGPQDYGYAGIADEQVPSGMPPGRVLERIAPGGPLRESQIGLLCDDPSGMAQVAALQAIARSAASRYGRLPHRMRPLHVDELPLQVTYREAMALDPDFVAPSPLWALVGVGGDALAPAGVDLLAEGPGFTVAGPPRSGRSTALRTMVECLLDPAAGGGLVPVVLITPRRSPLRELSGRPGVLGVLDAAARDKDLDVLLEGEHRYVIVADDAELLEPGELDDALARFLRRARDGEHAVVLAGTTRDLLGDHRGFLADARRSRSGLLLSMDSPGDGDLFGLRPPRTAAADGPAGRGLLVTPEATTPIQVALPA